MFEIIAVNAHSANAHSANAYSSFLSKIEKITCKHMSFNTKTASLSDLCCRYMISPPDINKLMVYAATNNLWSVVERTLELGADPTYANNHCIRCAAIIGCPTMVTMLLAYPHVAASKNDIIELTKPRARCYCAPCVVTNT